MRMMSCTRTQIPPMPFTDVLFRLLEFVVGEGQRAYYVHTVPDNRHCLMLFGPMMSFFHP
jgi:hypothetical protein